MWTVPDHSRGRARVCRGPCRRFLGSRWLRTVPSEDDVEGLELVSLSSAAAAVVAVAGAVEALGVLSDGGARWGVEQLLVLLPAFAVVLLVVSALLVPLSLGDASGGKRTLTVLLSLFA